MKFSPFELSGLRYYEASFNDAFEYYSVGDIHGCGKEFKELLKLIKKDAKSRGKIPKIIVHGDMIDRGPEFYEVFELLLEHDCIALLGNHEYNFSAERLWNKPCSSNSRKVTHERFEALNDFRQVSVMLALNDLYNFAVLETPERTFVLTHAPLKNMEKYKDWKSLLHIGNAPYFCMRSSIPIDEDIQNITKNVTFVYGHQSWEYRNIEEQKNEQVGRKAQYYNIDASCVYGGQLVALRLNDLGVLFVDSKVKVAK